MAQGNQLQSLVDHFVSQLQDQIRRQIDADLAGRIDAFKSQLMGSRSTAAPARSAAPVIRAPAKRGPRAGYKAEEKPCPICGKMSKARRFSYLCEDHRTDENRAKFRGNKGAPVAAPVAAKAAPAPGKRGRGRPKGSKNKPKIVAVTTAAAKSATAPARPPGKRGPGRPKGSKNKTKAAAGATAAPQ